jgi:Ca2+-binding EF-hand superfamily protein
LTDKDDCLDLSEISEKLHATGEPCTPEQQVAFFRWLDSNKDGKVDMKEWFKICARMMISGASSFKFKLALLIDQLVLIH